VCLLLLYKGVLHVFIELEFRLEVFEHKLVILLQGVHLVESSQVEGLLHDLFLKLLLVIQVQVLVFRDLGLTFRHVLFSLVEFVAFKHDVFTVHGGTLGV